MTTTEYLQTLAVSALMLFAMWGGWQMGKRHR